MTLKMKEKVRCRYVFLCKKFSSYIPFIFQVAVTNFQSWRNIFKVQVECALFPDNSKLGRWVCLRGLGFPCVRCSRQYFPGNSRCLPFSRQYFPDNSMCLPFLDSIFQIIPNQVGGVCLVRGLGVDCGNSFQPVVGEGCFQVTGISR